MTGDYANNAETATAGPPDQAKKRFLLLARECIAACGSFSWAGSTKLTLLASSLLDLAGLAAFSSFLRHDGGWLEGRLASARINRLKARNCTANGKMWGAVL